MCAGSKAPFPLWREGRFFDLSSASGRAPAPQADALACGARDRPGHATVRAARHRARPGHAAPPCRALPLRRPARARARGVTLVELMTTLTILAIVGTFGMTAFADAIARHRVQTALHLISADLAMARNSAISRRSHVIACPGDPLTGCRLDADWSHGWIVFSDPDGNRQPDSGADLIRVGNAPPGASRRLRLASTRNFVRYQRDGRSAGTNLTINVCTGAVLKGQVVVNNLGRVRSARAALEQNCPH